MSTERQDGQKVGWSIAKPILVIAAVIAMLNVVWLFQLQSQVKQIALQAADVQVLPNAVQQGAAVVSLDDIQTFVNSAIADGRGDLAETCLINVISKNPADVNLLTMYADFVIQQHEPWGTEIDRPLSVLESAMFQVVPGDIVKVEALVDRVSNHLQKRPPDSDPGNAIDATVAWKTWKQGNQTVEAADDVSLHVEKLQELASLIGPDHDAKMANEVSEELQKWQRGLMATQQTAIIDTFIANLESLSDEQLASQLGVALVQSAENSLQGVWAIQLDQLPEPIRARIAAYPEQIQNWVQKIAELRSEMPMQQVKAAQAELQQLLKTTKNVSNARYFEERCVQGEQLLQRVQGLLGEIPSQERQKEAAAIAQVMFKDVSAERQRQFDAYQAFVVAKCEAVFGKFNNEWHVSEDDARKFFDQYRLFEVDQRSLSPEVAMCFNDVLGKLLAEVSPATVVACQKKLSLGRKMKLSDF